MTSDNPAQQFMQLISRAFIRFFSMALLLLMHGASLMAQADDAEPAPEPKSWVLSYVLVLLLIGMALALVCRSGNRRTDVRQDLPAA